MRMIGKVKHWEKHTIENPLKATIGVGESHKLDGQFIQELQVFLDFKAKVQISLDENSHMLFLSMDLPGNEIGQTNHTVQMLLRRLSDECE